MDRRAAAGGAVDAGAGRCRARSSPGSPGTTGTSSTTWPRRSCTASPTMSSSSCCRPRSSTGSAARCATRSPARTAARPGWRRWSAANLFLVPLDDRRQWYRYHQLFADVLQAHLRDEQPGARSASCTGGQAPGTSDNGEPAEAIRHALAGEDFERAADLVELAIPLMRQNQAGGRDCGLARGAARRRGPGPAGAQRRVRRGVACSAASSRGRGPTGGRRAMV